ncbi:MAG: hypothetical protein OXF06_14030 [Bacteroidetes bacterium]|nr:hypothetical protein [Bacteroidota bacterium]
MGSDVWGSRSLLDHKVESTEVVKVVFDDVVTGAGFDEFADDDEEEGSESDGLG